MVFDLDRGLEVLERTPAVLDAMLRGLDDVWIAADEGSETWSPFDVVGHLVHGERTDWMARTRCILDHGPAKAFEPFDRFAQFEDSRGKSITDLLDEFDRLRRDNVAALRALDLGPEQLALEGRHPNLGPVTLEQLLATWVTHDLGHIAQIARVMAKVHRREVGPWAEYLAVLSDRPNSG